MLEMRLAATIQALRTTATGLIDMAYADEDLASLFLWLLSFLSLKKRMFFS